MIAYPTDSCYALGCQLGNKEGTARIRSVRQLDDRHHLTLVCRDFAQLGQLVHLSNRVFRVVKAATPGSYTFILPATREVPRRLQHPGKKTVGVRIPRHVVAQALLAELGEPLVPSTLLLPGQEEPLTQGWEINEEASGEGCRVMLQQQSADLEPGQEHPADARHVEHRDPLAQPGDLGRVGHYAFAANSCGINTIPTAG